VKHLFKAMAGALRSIVSSLSTFVSSGRVHGHLVS